MNKWKRVSERKGWILRKLTDKRAAKNTCTESVMPCRLRYVGSEFFHLHKCMETDITCTLTAYNKWQLCDWHLTGGKIGMCCVGSQSLWALADSNVFILDKLLKEIMTPCGVSFLKTLYWEWNSAWSSSQALTQIGSIIKYPSTLDVKLFMCFEVKQVICAECGKLVKHQLGCAAQLSVVLFSGWGLCSRQRGAHF